MFWKQMAVGPHEVFSVPLATCVVHVFIAHKKGGRRNFYFFHRKCFSQQLVLCTTDVYEEMPPCSSKKRVFTLLVRTLRYHDDSLSLTTNSLYPACTFVPRPVSRSFSASFWKASRQNTASVQIGDHRKARLCFGK